MSDLTAGIATAERVGDLAIRAPFVAPAAPCKAAVQHFWDDPALPALSVLDEAGAPVGIAGRDRLLGIFANEVHHALYERRPVARLMSRRPLVVEADTTIEAVAEQIAAAYPGAMQDGFIIVEQGRYLGIGTALDLMRSSAAQARARVIEVEEARRQSELASRSKSTFLANLSHELRTPLNAIIGFSELILAGIGGEPCEKHRDYVGSTLASGRLLLELINDLLDLSKAESGHLELHEEALDLAAVIRQACAVLRHRAAEAAVAFAVELPDAPVPFVGDERKLMQVVLNLAGNAVKYTRAGGAVVVRLRAARDGAAIEVEDTGIGVAEADLERILQPFVRASNAYIRSVEGTGIGLPLTKALVELHHGELRMASRLGIGTLATVKLPAARLVPAAEEALGSAA